MAEPTLFLFDGHNLLHAGGFADHADLVDRLASFVALRGARGVVVFDGAGADAAYGGLEVRYAPHADTQLERLAAERRDAERVCLVSSDAVIQETAGQEVAKLSSAEFLRELPALPAAAEPRHEVAGRLDESTRALLERLRRGR